MKNKSALLEKLEKSQEELDTVLETDEEDTDKLNKVFDSALDELGKSKKKPIKKAKKEDESDDEDADEDKDEDLDADDDTGEKEGAGEEEDAEGEDEDDSGEEKEPAKKSKSKGKKKPLEKSKSFSKTFEDDASSEVKQILNVEPFLKSVVKAIDVKFKAMEKSIALTHATMEDIAEVQEKQTDYFLSQGEIMKSLHNGMEVYGEQPQPRRAALTTRERFQKGKDDVQFDKDEINDFLNKAKLPSWQVAKIEGRMSKGMPLPDDIQEMMLKSKEDEDK